MQARVASMEDTKEARLAAVVQDRLFPTGMFKVFIGFLLLGVGLSAVGMYSPVTTRPPYTRTKTTSSEPRPAVADTTLTMSLHCCPSTCFELRSVPPDGATAATAPACLGDADPIGTQAGAQR